MLLVGITLPNLVIEPSSINLLLVVVPINLRLFLTLPYIRVSIDPLTIGIVNSTP